MRFGAWSCVDRGLESVCLKRVLETLVGSRLVGPNGDTLNPPLHVRRTLQICTARHPRKLIVRQSGAGPLGAGGRRALSPRGA